MQKLEKDANLEQVIEKINEIVDFLAENPNLDMAIAPDVKAYFDGLGGNAYEKA